MEESKMLEEFEKEIETLKKIIEGYISKNEILASFELDSLSLKLPEVASDEGGLNKENGASMVTTAANHTTATRKCKICRDSRGDAYCFFGSGDCPPR